MCRERYLCRARVVVFASSKDLLCTNPKLLISGNCRLPLIRQSAPFVRAVNHLIALLVFIAPIPRKAMSESSIFITQQVENPMQMTGQHKEAVFKKVSGSNSRCERQIACVIPLWSTVKGAARGELCESTILATSFIATTTKASKARAEHMEGK